MYHSLKKKEVKLPKGWQFSGDPSFLHLSNRNCKTYFVITNKRVAAYFRSGILLDEKTNEWGIDEFSRETNFSINRGTELTEIESKEIAIKLAREINRSQFYSRFFWILITGLVGVLLGAISTIIIQRKN